MPSSRQARRMRTAISPRLAIKILLNMPGFGVLRNSSMRLWRGSANGGAARLLRFVDKGLKDAPTSCAGSLLFGGAVFGFVECGDPKIGNYGGRWGRGFC